MSQDKHNPPLEKETDADGSKAKVSRIMPDNQVDNARKSGGESLGEPNLLDSARMQWQFGDWDALTSLSSEAVRNHPERAKLALLCAAAWQQKGDSAQACENLKLALSWGCDKRTAARVLVSTAHITLGRAAALQRDEQRALQHFKHSVKGVSGDARLACQARTTRELMRLGLMHDAARFVQEQSGRLPGAHRGSVFGSSPGPKLSHESHRLLSRSMESPGSESRLILVAGMRHSGSTALFNVVRLAVETASVSVVSGYAEQNGTEELLLESTGIRLIKIHEFRDDMASKAGLVLTTRRDLRDSVASAARRKFPSYSTHGGSVGYAKYNRSLHEIWAGRSHYEFVYERFMRSPIAVVEEVMAILGLDVRDAQSVFEKVESLPTDDYKTTLLSPKHITDPGRVRSYADTLLKEEIEKIEKQHFEWLLKYDYPISGSKN